MNSSITKDRIVYAPRFLISAVSSGSGKTLITCGILQALINRGLDVTSCKCGPDYIDPMFHSTIIGTETLNLDTFFTNEPFTNYLLCNHAKNADITILEGVMGFYDGIGGVSTNASSYEAAKITNTPVILILDCKGMSLSVLALLKGIMEYQPDTCIAGVILNGVSPAIYPKLKILIESRLSTNVVGYVPYLGDFTLESRHLGLVTPTEVSDLKETMQKLASTLEETLNISLLLEIARKAPPLNSYSTWTFWNQVFPVVPLKKKPVIAVAKDRAFCFYYKDNLELLEDLGAALVYFSPLTDQALPDCDGLLLGGGYPELYAKELSENISMREDIKKKIQLGLPTIAECGGFMYLHEQLEDNSHKIFPMAGVISGKIFPTDKLCRFGYITLFPDTENFLLPMDETIRGHEFHYWDSTNNGNCLTARKPIPAVPELCMDQPPSWETSHTADSLWAGFPHIYFYSNPKLAYTFVKACSQYR